MSTGKVHTKHSSSVIMIILIELGSLENNVEWKWFGLAFFGMASILSLTFIEICSAFVFYKTK